MAEDYMEEDATPSQQALDSQLEGQRQYAEAERRGRLALAATQVSEAIKGGASRDTGRYLLGRLDSLAQDAEADDPDALYAEFSQFLRQRPATPGQSPGQSSTPVKKTVDLNKAREAYASGKITTGEAEKLGIVG